MLSNIKIAFQNMEHSEPLDSHTRSKLQKVSDMLSKEENITPLFAEFWLKSHKQHPHSSAEFHLKTPRFDLHAHDEGTDLYVVVDNTIDKMVAQLKKEKERFRESHRKPDSEKSRFGR
ncbi:MAG: hypothetical protein US49_C0002G0001 [candidate division TM6 bacterium GW2011_GWF2_37_49]|nr:MAG: hypothetical protein US49_C0002G0001 [candidate division TM6 bacterium GW2011_GWF2_37_49]